MTDFNVAAMTDIKNTLELDNLPVMHINQYMNDVSYSKFRSVTTSSDENISGAHSYYFEFINNFAQYDCGIIVSNRVMTHLSANPVEGSVPTYLPIKSWCTFSDVGKQIPIFHPFSYDASPTVAHIGACPYYMYNGANVAFFAIGHINHCMLFVKLKSIDDDSVTKYVIMMACNTNARTYNSDPFYYGTYRNVYIMDNPNYVYTKYENNMKLNAYDGSKVYIEKFIYNGYYSDEIFIFDGVCPNGIFKLNNDTYMNIGSNLYLKIT